MKKILLVVLPLMALTIVSTCDAGIAGFFSQEHRDWSFIQAVGGMKVSVAKKHLLVDCDVSGTKTITTRPTTVNSGIGVRKLRCSRVGSTIRVSVVTSVIEKGMRSDCGSVDVSAYPAGAYDVVYLNPDGTVHPLDTIVVP